MIDSTAVALETCVEAIAIAALPRLKAARR